MGYILWGHRGSGDHGCEDYLRGLCTLLPEPPQIYSHCPREDWHYGICTLASVCRNEPKTIRSRLKPGDWCFQTRATEVRDLRRRGVHPVLFYCTSSVPSPKQLRLLSGYEIVAVTEKRSRQVLCDSGLSNVIQFPDPAFLVNRQIRDPEDCFWEDTVGLCLSYPPEAGELLLKNYQRLIEYILSRTPLHIALIPYCIKPRSNDMLLHRVLYGQYGDTGRIHLRQDADSQKLRGDISLCRFCVGCAGAVAAWSCSVPALCLCANGRTVGIAQTLFGSHQNAIAPWQLLKGEYDLSCCFQMLLQQEDGQRRCLQQHIHELRTG